jgi:hypothetical protein
MTSWSFSHYSSDANCCSACHEIHRHLWRRGFITMLTIISRRNPAPMRDTLFIFYVFQDLFLILSSYIYKSLLSDNFPSGIPLKLWTLLSPVIIMPHSLLLHLHWLHIQNLKVTQKCLIIVADGFSFHDPSSYRSTLICTGGYKSALCHKAAARSEQGSAELRLCFRLFSCRLLSLCWTSVFSVGGASACLYGREITRPGLVAVMWPSHSVIIWNYTRCTKNFIFW